MARVRTDRAPKRLPTVAQRGTLLQIYSRLLLEGKDTAHAKVSGRYRLTPTWMPWCATFTGTLLSLQARGWLRSWPSRHHRCRWFKITPAGIKAAVDLCRRLHVHDSNGLYWQLIPKEIPFAPQLATLLRTDDPALSFTRSTAFVTFLEGEPERKAKWIDAEAPKVSRRHPCREKKPRVDLNYHGVWGVGRGPS